MGAGDIGMCGAAEPEATAKLLDHVLGSVFTLGDNVQGNGSAEEYRKCYDPSWGRHLYRTYPTIGNHDVDYTGGGPYFAYFGDAAGPPGLGYYSVTLGAWQVISLNSQTAAGSGSAQYAWLKQVLAASTASCTVVMWHMPLFTSGPSGGAAGMRDAWRLLQQYGVDLVLNGHDHNYERFAPQDADGRASATGIREFVVGTGGYTLYGRAASAANSEIWNGRDWGVLKLTLKTGGYDWEFIPIAGGTFHDFGAGTCITVPR